MVGCTQQNYVACEVEESIVFSFVCTRTCVRLQVYRLAEEQMVHIFETESIVVDVRRVKGVGQGQLYSTLYSIHFSIQVCSRL